MIVVSAVTDSSRQTIDAFIARLHDQGCLPRENIESLDIGITRRSLQTQPLRESDSSHLPTTDSSQSLLSPSWDTHTKRPVTLYKLNKSGEHAVQENNRSKDEGNVQSSALPATFYGVGVGPGDPELITLKAQRLIQQADVISYLCNANGKSQALDIAAHIVDDSKQSEKILLPIVMPMKEEREFANQAYDQAANAIGHCLHNNQTVVFLCEGDPLFFGSFTYLLERLQTSHKEYGCHVVPGISSINAAASRLQHPLTMLTESFAVMSGRHSEQQLSDALRQHDSVVIMKAGRARKTILQALIFSDRIDEAIYLEYVGRPEEKIVRDVRQLDEESGPYFSLFVVTNNAHQRALLSS